MSRWDDLSSKIRQGGEHPVTLSVRRGDRDFQLQVTPQRMETADIFGGKVSAVIIGISSGDRPAVEQVGPFRALQPERGVYRAPYLADRGEHV